MAFLALFFFRFARSWCLGPAFSRAPSCHPFLFPYLFPSPLAFLAGGLVVRVSCSFPRAIFLHGVARDLSWNVGCSFGNFLALSSQLPAVLRTLGRADVSCQLNSQAPSFAPIFCNLAIFLLAPSLAAFAHPASLPAARSALSSPRLHSVRVVTVRCLLGRVLYVSYRFFAVFQSHCSHSSPRLSSVCQVPPHSRLALFAAFGFRTSPHHLGYFHGSSFLVHCFAYLSLVGTFLWLLFSSRDIATGLHSGVFPFRPPHSCIELFCLLLAEGPLALASFPILLVFLCAFLRFVLSLFFFSLPPFSFPPGLIRLSFPLPALTSFHPPSLSLPFRP